MNIIIIMIIDRDTIYRVSTVFLFFQKKKRSSQNFTFETGSSVYKKFSFYFKTSATKLAASSKAIAA